jgi:hypothetical protein
MPGSLRAGATGGHGPRACAVYLLLVEGRCSHELPSKIRHEILKSAIPYPAEASIGNSTAKVTHNAPSVSPKRLPLARPARALSHTPVRPLLPWFKVDGEFSTDSVRFCVCKH